MTIYLIRHGETDGNKNRVVQLPEVPLNQRGRQQAERLASRLCSEGRTISRVISSDLTRARETAEPLARALGVELELDGRLQERNFGDLRGRAYDEIGIDIMAEGYTPPAGESWPQFHARVEDLCAQGLAGWDVEEGTALVTHGLVCHAMALFALELAASSVPQRWGNTALTVFRHRPVQIERINCVVHLDDDSADDEAAPSGL